MSISSVPKLLRHLNLNGAIIQAEADYLLVLKGNQGSFHDDVYGFSAKPKNLEYAPQKGGTIDIGEHHDKGHRRIE